MKNFLSIGTGPGMGLETAERFAREGYRVILSARNEGRLKEFAEQMTAKGYAAIYETVDAGNPESIAKLVSNTESRFGPVDTLHYNAAIVHKTSVDNMDTSVFQQDVTVDITSAYAAIRAVLPSMTKQSQGTILLTGGGLANYPSSEYLSLGVGKAGIRYLALALFEDLKKRGIHIATVTVSATVVPGSKEATAAAEEFYKLAAQQKAAWTAETTFTG
jgi:short-subunit dehydrogenase